jgi:hypothetical protein
MFCGATFLPPAVTMMSFLRSVMRRKPSASMTPMSPVWNQPSASMASAWRRALVVAAHHAAAADEELAVGGDLDLGAGERAADGAERTEAAG